MILGSMYALYWPLESLGTGCRQVLGLGAHQGWIAGDYMLGLLGSCSLVPGPQRFLHMRDLPGLAATECWSNTALIKVEYIP